MELFITHQTKDAMHEEFVMAALLECMRLLPTDLFSLSEAELKEFNDAMQAYLNK
jgi:hypothetical protein